MAYDAERDAAEMARALDEWADHGFLVGLTNARRSRPGDAFVSRSSAFFHVFTTGLGVPSTLDAEELERRLAYGEAVQETLHRSESAALARRYRLISRGMTVRFVSLMALLLVTATVAICWSEMGAIGLFALSFLGATLLSIGVGGKDDFLYEASLGKAQEPIKLPWLSGTGDKSPMSPSRRVRSKA